MMDAFETTLDQSLADTEAAVRQALAESGFGILTEIDVAARLGAQRPPLKILGACNPTFAHRTLGVEATAALQRAVAYLAR